MQWWNDFLDWLNSDDGWTHHHGCGPPVRRDPRRRPHRRPHRARHDGPHRPAARPRVPVLRCRGTRHRGQVGRPLAQPLPRREGALRDPRERGRHLGATAADLRRRPRGRLGGAPARRDARQLGELLVPGRPDALRVPRPPGPLAAQARARRRSCSPTTSTAGATTTASPIRSPSSSSAGQRSSSSRRTTRHPSTRPSSRSPARSRRPSPESGRSSAFRA